MDEIKIAALQKSVGTDIGLSDWVVIDQERINKFAEATGDFQWIHVDEARASRELPGGKTIAHGYLTLSLIPWLCKGNLKVEGASRGINYGSNKVRFASMVPVGSRVRARQKLMEARPRGDSLQVLTEVTIEIEGNDRPACIAEIISLLFFD